MKKNLTLIVSAFMLVLFMAGASMAQNIDIINGTSFQIHALAVSPSETNDWNDDLLGKEILEPGEALTVEISGESTGWDLAAVDDEGQQIEFKNLNFTNVSKVTLFSDGTMRLE